MNEESGFSKCSRLVRVLISSVAVGLKSPDLTTFQAGRYWKRCWLCFFNTPDFAQIPKFSVIVPLKLIFYLLFKSCVSLFSLWELGMFVERNLSCYDLQSLPNHKAKKSIPQT